MKELDFLPRDFHEARRRRYLMRRNTLYLIALGIALGCLHFVNGSQLRSAKASLDAFHAGDHERNLQRNRLRELRAGKQGLEARLGLLSRLDDDAPLDIVVAQITRYMNDSMAIRSLVVESTPLENADPEASDPLLDRGPTQVVLGGIAATDVEVGIFFGRVAECALFDDVKLSFSRKIEEAGRQMCEFELIFKVRRVLSKR